MAPVMISDDDSDDDVPLAARPKSAAKRSARDSSSSEEPEWMKTFRSPVQKIVDTLSDDDDDDDDDMVFHQAVTGRSPAKFEMGSTPAKMVKSPPTAAGGDDEAEPEEDDDSDVQVAAEVPPESEGPGEKSKSPPKPKPPPSPPPAASTQPAHPPRPPSAIPTPSRPGELPLFVPAALNRSKVIFECEGAGEAVDLEGDVGVVGRLLTEASSMQMDLKGVVYNARVLPTPASVVILSVTQSEAKIDSVANDFVQLREDPRSNNPGTTTLDGYLGVDSDDEDRHRGRAAAGQSAAAAVRAMDDVSDDEAPGSAKRKGRAGGAGGADGGGKARKLGADGKRQTGAKRATKKPKKKTAKKPKKR
jgi:hypothetical protein